MRLIDADKLRHEIHCAYSDDLEILEHIDAQPTVQPQRIPGKWMPEFNGRFTGGAYWVSCSRCKRIVPDVRNGGWDFCPSCGADMREGQDETDRC